MGYKSLKRLSKIFRVLKEDPDAFHSKEVIPAYVNNLFYDENRIFLAIM